MALWRVPEFKETTSTNSGELIQGLFSREKGKGGKSDRGGGRGAELGVYKVWNTQGRAEARGWAEKSAP